MEALVAKVLAVLALVNVVLMAADAGLEKIKDLTASDLDNKIYAYVHKAASLLQTVIQFISANRPNTPPAAPAA